MQGDAEVGREIDGQSQPEVQRMPRRRSHVFSYYF
jgi:hypothetical protein